MTDTPLPISHSLSTEQSSASADILQPDCTGKGASSNSLVSSVSAPVLSNDSMLAHRVGVEDRVSGDSSEDREADSNDWFSYKPVITDELGLVHDDLDMVDMEDCPSMFAGESVCNTIDFDTIIDLGLNTTDVTTGLRSRDGGQDGFAGEPEIISGQSCFTDSAKQSADSITGDDIHVYVDDIQDKDVLSATVGRGIQLICTDATKTVAVKPTSMSVDVPSCTSSNVLQLSSVKCELSTSFLTPKTPTHSQLATHFSFSSPEGLQSSPLLASRPKTPVVSLSLPVCTRSQLSPHAPYTPDTPSIFQFPSPNQSPASSSNCSPISRHSKRHTATYHPYSSPSASTSSPRYLSQQQASVQQLEQQKRLELEAADSAIDQHIRKLQQTELQKTQQLQTRDARPKELLSKLSVTVPAETGATSGTDSGITASCRGQAVSPIEEVIQILVAEHFGVTVPSKFIQDDFKHSCGDPKVHIELTSAPATASNTVQCPVTEEFRNPGTVTSKPRKRKPEPLVIPASVSNFGFRSQLRSPQLCESSYVAQQCRTSTPPYTPPPMISPARTGSGVFWTVRGSRQIPAGPLSAPPCHTSFPCMYDVLLY